MKDKHTLPGQILGLGSPFFDRFAFVEEGFLKEIDLIKGDTSLTVDLAYLEKIWKLGSKSEDQHTFKLGGSAVNVIKVLAKFGHKTALCGKIGVDERSEKLIKRLENLGISHFLSKGSLGIGVVNCFVTLDKQRTMLSYLGAAGELSEQDLIPEIFKSISHLHIEGYSACYGLCLERSVSLAKNSGATISIDLSSPTVVRLFKERIFKVLKNVDFVFGNKAEIVALHDELSSLEHIFATFNINQTVVATNGALGCFVKGSGETSFKQYDALKVKDVIDTTGAGDYFDGGFLHGILTGKTIKECVGFGNMAASAIIQELGADLPDDKWLDLFRS